MYRLLSDCIVSGSFSVGTQSNTFFVSNNGDVGIRVKGFTSDSTSYALKVDNSSSSALLYVRNDGYIGVGTTPDAHTRLLIKSITDDGNTVSLLFNTAANSYYGQFLSTSSTRGRFAFNAAFNSDSTFGIKNGTGTRILRLIDSSDVNVLEVLNNNNVLFSNSVDLSANVSIRANSNTNTFIVSDSTQATYNFVVRNDGKSGFGVNSPTATTHIKGSTSDNTAYALKVDNSSSSALLYVMNDGNVGIGTASPSYKLHSYTTSGSYQPLLVAESTSTLSMVDIACITGNNSLSLGVKGNSVNAFPGYGSNNEGHLYSGIGVSGFNFISADPISYKFYNSTANGTTPVLSINDGRVGINCNNSAYVFQVNDRDTQLIKLFNINNTTGEVGVSVASPTARLHVKGSTSDSTAYALKVDNSSSSALLYVRNDSNVGIGTASPTSKLHIKGIGTSSGTYSLKIDDGSNNPLLHVRDDGYFDAGNGNLIAYDNGSNIFIGANKYSGLNIGPYNTPFVYFDIQNLRTIIYNESIIGGSSTGLVGNTARVKISGDGSLGVRNIGFQYNGNNGFTDYAIGNESDGLNTTIRLSFNPTQFGYGGVATGLDANNSWRIGIGTSSVSSHRVVISDGLKLHSTTFSSSTFEIQTSAGTPSFIVQNDGNIGIGLTGPDTKFHIYDVAGLGAFKLDDGSQNKDYILSCDVDGLAIWKSPTSSAILGYKKYVALISQFGTASPTAVVLENTLSGEPVYSRTALGEYYITLNGEFTANKTAILFQNAIRTIPNMMFIASITRISDDQIVIYTKNSSGTSVEDGIIEDQTLEIRVYI